MAFISVELEYLGPNGWLGRVVTPRTGREVRATDLDAALEQVRRVCAEFGAPAAPVVLEPPRPMPEVEPRHPRHKPRGEEQPQRQVVGAEQSAAAGASEPPDWKKPPIGKRRAHEMRAAADEAAMARDPGLAERAGMMRTRRL